MNPFKIGDVVRYDLSKAPHFGIGGGYSQLQISLSEQKLTIIDIEGSYCWFDGLETNSHWDRLTLQKNLFLDGILKNYD